jgi:hypothetical protein
MVIGDSQDKTTRSRQSSGPAVTALIRAIRYPFYGSQDPSREWAPDDERTICLADVDIIIDGVTTEDYPLTFRDIRVTPGKDNGYYINFASQQNKLKKAKVDAGMTSIESQRELYQEFASVPARMAAIIRDAITEVLDQATIDALTDKWLSDMDTLNPEAAALFEGRNPHLFAGDMQAVVPVAPPAPVAAPEAPKRRAPRPMPAAVVDSDEPFGDD